ncbi:hypothetical protein HMPREF3159_11915 [Brachybacterium sp. HMSC06H03]|uniref:hypothetical protein n=1 Tax=Brachybacterium sp. HMSC06H03 TaxID=1581127 RepID=UPI0008A3D156|nr:hypothetical protein [Brachybacterium sp. HMSC06H03]OFT50715.1 hypothetical protein HMPREF3159_11915 [Brachybacterium sp. HMSC06H03]
MAKIVEFRAVGLAVLESRPPFVHHGQPLCTPLASSSTAVCTSSTGPSCRERSAAGVALQRNGVPEQRS